MLYFFLSYAPGQSDDLAGQFFDDLCAEVREHVGCERGEPVGFREPRDPRGGESWPVELVEALQGCRSLVALLSPRYLNSRACGKEWGVFAERLRRYRASTGRQASLLMPVFWIPTTLPDDLSHIQYRDRSFGDEYDRHGLRELMRLRKYRDAYLEFVTSLAVRLTATGLPDVPPLPVTPDFRTAPSGFATGPSTAPEPGNGQRRNNGNAAHGSRQFRQRPIPRRLPLVGYEDDDIDDAQHPAG